MEEAERVAILTVNFAPETTGIAPYTTSLARGLAERGFDVSVATAAPHYPEWKTRPQTHWRKAEEANGVKIRRIRSYVPRKPNVVSRTVFEVLYGLRLAAQSFKSTDAVVLVSPALFTSAIVCLRVLSQKERPRIVLWIQDRYSAGVQEIPSAVGRVAGGLVRSVESWLAKHADYVVVIHEQWVASTAATLDIPRERIRVIRNWTHFDIPDDTDTEVTREHLGWGPRGSEIIALHTGNMGAKQGLENVVEAAKLARDRRLPVRFILVGDGNQKRALQDLARDYSPVEFWPSLPQDDFLRTLGAADVLILNEAPGLRETAVPSKLTSYFTTRRPVLAATESNSVSAEEVRLSRAGVVIPPGDPRELLDGVLRLAVSDDIDPSSGQAFVRQKLSQDAGIAAFTQLLTSENRSPDPLPDKKGARS